MGILFCTVSGVIFGILIICISHLSTDLITKNKKEQEFHFRNDNKPKITEDEKDELIVENELLSDRVKELEAMLRVKDRQNKMEEEQLKKHIKQMFEGVNK